jgi:adenine-specific DNA-methyltransferase
MMPADNPVPATRVDHLRLIESRLQAFRSGSLHTNAVNLLNALGYDSDKTIDLESDTAAGVLALANRKDFFSREKARPEEWSSAHFLFQLTDEEISHRNQPAFAFNSQTVDVNSDKQVERYIFFAVQLKRDSYSRPVLADITREINKLFPMPALVLFRHGRTLTLSIIPRRINRRDAARDVLEKVTLIKDIRVENPHRAHKEILFDLAFSQLAAQYKIENFFDLQEAWRQTLDISELNKRFYKDLANWYFWAREQVKFPAQPDVTDDENSATNVIRLITRLIFVWFLKERGLVPDGLFHREHLAQAVLKDLSPTSSTFYKAILQNLFFATLNTPMKDAENPREFRSETEEGKRFNNQYMVHNQYRHKKLFRNPDAALEMFASIPFLNGGLFECLDKREEVNGKPVEIRVDGFSDVERKQPTVPNRLFFCEEHNCADDGVDLNLVYGTRTTTYKVRGLIDTLDRYKFTIAESTPIEEEVALDPELLGKVFENLLASYNPETGATARKQTGSFYTPREIVNYMVDESLIAYLDTQLAPPTNGRQAQSAVMRQSDAQSSFTGQQPLVLAEAVAGSEDGSASGDASLQNRLRQLFAYTDEPHEFTEAEIENLIKAIDGVKILDPACGSGAFPMGILGKLVFILARLDPQNARWKEAQLRRVGDDERKARELNDEDARDSALAELTRRRADIEEAFVLNELDYGRKLFLIENCIYGVDIQPIAIQIAKLRFFISLIIDQKIRAESENLGVRPLPNLETKFVAANTLLGIEKPAQSMLQNEELRHALEEKERELKTVRERHFTARTIQAKEKYRNDDKRLRHEIGKLLEEDNWSPETTAKLVRWNPYDQNASADFFDSERMFSVTEGFNIVIANPPYGADIDSLIRQLTKLYPSTTKGFNDIYKIFIEAAFTKLAEARAVISYIVPNTLLRQPRYKDVRTFLMKFRLMNLLNLGEGVFEQVVVPTCVFVARNDKPQNGALVSFRDLSVNSLFSGDLLSSDEQLLEQSVIFEGATNALLSKGSFKQLNDILDFKDAGINYQRVNVGLSQKGKSDLGQRLLYEGTRESRDDVEFWKGEDIYSYAIANSTNRFVRVSTVQSLRNNERVILNQKYFERTPKIIWRQTASFPIAALDSKGIWFGRSIQAGIIKKEYSHLRYEYVLAILNSTYFRHLYNSKVREAGRVFPQVKLENLRPLPVPDVDISKQTPIVGLASQILAAKRKDMNADTCELEREIDQLVYQLYNLTPGEIAIVEASAGKK